MLTVEEQKEILSTIRDIKKQQDETTNTLAGMTKAFPKNDLGDPDYDGHRKDHLTSREHDKLIREYKVDATKKILWSGIAFLGLLLGTGFTEQIKGIFK